jgi:hypothetical protein
VIAATDAAFGNDAVFERGAAVAALPMQYADIARQIAESDEIFAENSDCER